MTPLRQLKKFPNIPVSTQEEPRVSRHNSRRAPVSPPQLEMRVHSPASSAKESRCSCRTSGGGWSHLETREELHVSCHCLKRPRCPHPLEIRPQSLVTTGNVTLRINSRHEGRPESPVEPLEIAPDPYLNLTGGLTPLFHLEREAQFHGPTRDDI